MCEWSQFNFSAANDVQHRLDNAREEQSLIYNDAITVSNNRIHHSFDSTNAHFGGNSTCSTVNTNPNGDGDDGSNTVSRAGNSCDIISTDMVDKSKLNWNWNPYHQSSPRMVQTEERAIKNNHELLNNNDCHPNSYQTASDCDRTIPANMLGSINQSIVDTGGGGGGGGAFAGEQQTGGGGTTIVPMSERNLSGIEEMPPAPPVQNDINKANSQTGIIAEVSETHHRGNIGPNAIEQKTQLRVCVNRLKSSDVQLMQTSIKTFIQKSPALANKIGLLSVVDHNVDMKDKEGATTTIDQLTQDQLTSTSSAISADSQQRRNSLIDTDTFNIIKASEKQASNSKRRQHMTSFDDLPPDQICKLLHTSAMTFPVKWKH